jgi:hypothetical protein
MTAPINTDTLQKAYYEVVRNNGINGLVCLLRQNPTARYNIRRQDLLNLFSNLPLWKRTDSGDGHVCFQNILTNVRIGFQGHGKTTEIKASQAMDIMEQLQEHMNILGNDIFAYRTRSWKYEPNYEQAVANYNRLYGKAA